MFVLLVVIFSVIIVEPISYGVKVLGRESVL